MIHSFGGKMFAKDRGLVSQVLVFIVCFVVLGLTRSAEACWFDFTSVCYPNYMEVDTGVCGGAGYFCTYDGIHGFCPSVPSPTCPSTPPSSPGDRSSPTRDPKISCGSIIHGDSQTLIETIPVVGTPFSLVYSSDRVPGNTTWYESTIPFTGSSVSGTLTQVALAVTVGSEVSNYTDSSPAANDVKNFTWDGKDNMGNPVAGSQTYTTATTETDTSMCSPDCLLEGGNFGAPGDPLGPRYLGFTYINWVGLGGWDVSIHHSYDFIRKVIYFGDGTSLDAPYSSAGGGNYMVVSKDASEVYIFDSNFHHVYTKTGMLGTTKYTFAYNGSGQLYTITDAYSNVTTFNYSGTNLSSISAPYGQSTSVSTTSVSGTYYLSSVTNPNSETYNMTYYTGGLLHTFEKPSTVTSTMTYASDGRLLSDSSAAGSSDTLSISGLGTGGWTVSESSAMSRASSSAVTDNGLSGYSRVDTDPASYYSTYTYTAGSNSTSFSDVLGYSDGSSSATDARFGSDAQFLNSDVSYEGSYSKAYSASQTATMTGGDPFSTTAYEEDYTVNSKNSSLVYTGSTKTYVYTSPESRTFTRIMDSNERTTSTQLASLTPLTYSYDGNGRLQEIDQGMSRATTFAYYSSGGHKGLLNTVTDAASHTTTFDYDSAGRVNSETLPDSRSISFGYDSNGNLNSVTPPGKSAHALNHNGFDLLSSYVTPTALIRLKEAEEKSENFIMRWGQKLAKSFKSFSPWLSKKTEKLFTGYTTTYAYNNDKQLHVITRPDTNTITFDYDSGTGVLGDIVIPTGTNYYTFNYGKLPNTNSSLDSVSQSFSWSGNLLASSTTDFEYTNTYTGTVNYVYNSDFLKYSDTVTSNGTPTGTTIDYVYDDDNRLTNAGDEDITPDTYTGFYTQATLGAHIEEDYTYTTDFGELSDITAKYSGTTKYEEAITRDAVGRVHQKVENYLGTSHTYVYTYETSGRLSSVTKDSSAYESYTYDSNSNIIAQTVSGVSPSPTPSYDGQDRLVNWGQKSYTFSSSGELEEISDASHSPAWVTDYTYDALGNLKSVTLPSSTVINYTVDANNRRTARLTGATVNNYYVWGSHNELLALLDSSGNITARFVYGTKSNIPDYMYDSGGVEYKIVSNHLGSPVLVIKSSTGTIEEEIQYDDYGNILSDTSPGYQPFGFAGCLYDQDTKLCRFGARDYDASTGRWTNRDPILFKGGDTNLFGYVIQDPVNKRDPSGKQYVVPNPAPEPVLPEPPENGGQGPLDQTEVCQMHPEICSTPVPFGAPDPFGTPRPQPPFNPNCRPDQQCCVPK